MHVVSLLANAGLRNKWCTDDLLKVSWLVFNMCMRLIPACRLVCCRLRLTPSTPLSIFLHRGCPTSYSDLACS